MHGLCAINRVEPENGETSFCILFNFEFPVPTFPQPVLSCKYVSSQSIDPARRKCLKYDVTQLVRTSINC